MLKHPAPISARDGADTQAFWNERMVGKKGTWSQKQLADFIVDNTLMEEDCSKSKSESQKMAEHALLAAQ